MNVINHRFDEASGSMNGALSSLGSGPDTSAIAPLASSGSNEHDPSDARVPAWIDRYSLKMKLRTATLGNVAVLGSMALIILGCWLYFVDWGEELGGMISAERNAAQAALLLDDAAVALSDGRGEGGTVTSAKVAGALDEAFDCIEKGKQWIPADLPGDAAQELGSLQERIQDLGVKNAALSASSLPSKIAELKADILSTKADLREYIGAMRAQVSANSLRFYHAAPWALTGAGVLLLVSIIFAVAGVNVINRNVVVVIQSITGSMTRLASGDTNARIPGRQRADEIGEMARALEIFRTRSLELNTLNETRASEAEDQLGQQQALNEKAAKLRSETSEVLDALASQFDASGGELIGSVSAAIAQLRRTSDMMGELSHESSEQSCSASQAMEQADVNVTAAAAATDELSLSINEISYQAAGSAALAREASGLVDAANSQMNILADAAEEIGEIVGLIQTIAQRTNLLALNASIEAARGGEAGRGFAVVASEVKELANQTSAATKNVGDRIHSIQSSTRAGVGALTSMVEKITELEQSSGVIASAVDQQSLSTEELARNIDVAASGSANVVLRLEKMQSASHATSQAVEEVLQGANELGRVADEMQKRADSFTAEIRKSARGLDVAEGNPC